MAGFLRDETDEVFWVLKHHLRHTLSRSRIILKPRNTSGVHDRNLLVR
jgi:hypothetical protein